MAEHRSRRPSTLPGSTAVGVVGAGITGLALTRALDRAGVPAVTLEAAPEPGGVIRTREREGRPLDLGPQRTRLSGPVAELVADLDLSVRRADPDLGLLVYHDGALRRAPLSPAAAVRTDLLSTRGKVRTLLEPLTRPPRPEESVADFFERSFGTEAARRFLGPLYSGLYGSDPGEMPVEHSLGTALSEAGIGRSVLLGGLRKLLRMRLRGRERPPAVTFERGMAALPRALYRAHEDRVHLSTPVGAIRADGDRYRLETPREAVTVDEIVLTAPAPASAELLEPLAPAAAADLRELRYNPLAVVHLELEADPDREAMGFLVADGETPLLGSTWNGVAFDRDGVVTCYLGGGDRPDLVDEPDHTLGSLAAREFRRLVGPSGRPLSVHRVRPGMPAYDRSWSALDGLALPEGVGLCANFHARAGIPGRIRAARETARSVAGRVTA